jgi:N-acetylmuramoyl-L-alanine amidase
MGQRGGRLAKLALFFFVASFLLLPGLLDPGNLWADGELARALASEEKFLQNGGSGKRSEWVALVKQFELAAEAQPQIGPASRARYHAADVALRSFEKFGQAPDAKTASSLSRRSVKDCPRCSDAPRALLVLGRALVAQGLPEEAYRELMKVELNYREATGAVLESRELMAKLSGKPLPKKADPPKAQSQAGPSPSPSPGPSQSEAPEAPRASVAKAKAPAPPKERQAPKPPSPRADGLAQVFALYLDDQGSYTEITAYLDRVTPYLYNLLPPSREGGYFRVYVDFKESRLSRKLTRGPAATTSLIKTIKANQLNDDTVRMVADMPAAYPYTPVFLDNPPRMIIRVAKDTQGLPPVEAEDPPTPREVAKAKPKPEPPRPAKGPRDSMARQLGLGIRLVAIDAGHGGKDGGAAGNGLKEKDIVLKASKMLAQKISSRLRLEVIMTRDSDKFVTLDRRTLTAREKKADLFISVHVNANDLAKVEGIESYILNFASDPTAMAVAARENASSGKTMSEMEDLVQKIAKNTKVAESRVLAKAIHSGALASVRKQHKARDLGVKEAAFIVLANVDVPAVLLEIGFITNKAESQRLSQDAYLELLTDGICLGLKNYLDGLR